jgi:hypothetical protein
MLLSPASPQGEDSRVKDYAEKVRSLQLNIWHGHGQNQNALTSNYKRRPGNSQQQALLHSKGWQTDVWPRFVLLDHTVINLTNPRTLNPTTIRSASSQIISQLRHWSDLWILLQQQITEEGIGETISSWLARRQAFLEGAELPVHSGAEVLAWGDHKG